MKSLLPEGVSSFWSSDYGHASPCCPTSWLAEGAPGWIRRVLKTCMFVCLPATTDPGRNVLAVVARVQSLPGSDVEASQSIGTGPKSKSVVVAFAP